MAKRDKSNINIVGVSTAKSRTTSPSLARDSLKTSEKRRTFLTEKKLCYNCTGAKHRASECNSKQMCQNCGRRHHTSICDQEKEPEKMLAARHSNDHQLIYPVVVMLMV